MNWVRGGVVGAMCVGEGRDRGSTLVTRIFKTSRRQPCLTLAKRFDPENKHSFQTQTTKQTMGRIGGFVITPPPSFPSSNYIKKKILNSKPPSLARRNNPNLLNSLPNPPAPPRPDAHALDLSPPLSRNLRLDPPPPAQTCAAARRTREAELCGDVEGRVEFAGRGGSQERSELGRGSGEGTWGGGFEGFCGEVEGVSLCR